MWAEKGGENVDQLDAITLLYLEKNWNGEGSLLDFAHKFQQTKAELSDALKKERSAAINERITSGNPMF